MTEQGVAAQTGLAKKRGLHAVGVFLILGLVAIVVWHKTLSNGFVWRDVPEVAANLALRDGSTIGDYFFDANTSVSPGWPGATPVFRPLRTLSYRLDVIVGGVMDPRTGHAHSLLVHLVNSLLLLALARMLGLGVTGSLFVALIFLVHPVQSEAVCWLVCRDVLQGTTLVLLGLLYGVWRATRGWRVLDVAVLGIVYLAACLASPQAIVFPLLLGIAAIAARAESVPENGKDERALCPREFAGVIGAAVMFAGVAAFYAWWSLSATEGVGVLQSDVTGGWRVKLLSVPRIIGLLLAPTTLTPDYSDVGTGQAGDGVLAALGGVLLAFVVLLAVRCWRVKPVLCAALAFGWLGVFSGWLIGSGFPGERLLYLPMAGFALAAGLLVQMLAAIRMQAAVTVVGIVLVLASVRTMLRVGDWEDEGRLLYPALTYSPGNKVVLRQLMRHYFAVRDFRRATVVADGLLDVTPPGPGFGVMRAEPLRIKGLSIMATGTVEQGTALLNESVAADPYYGRPLHDFGLMELKAGRTDAALSLLRKGCSLMPHDSGVHEHLGVALTMIGKTNIAEVAFGHAVENEWAIPSAARRLAAILMEQGRRKEGAEVCRRSLRRFPGDPVLSMLLEKASGTDAG